MSMNIENLTQVEVKELIERLKNPTNEFAFRRVYNDINALALLPVNKKHKLEILDPVDGIEYVLNVNETPISSVFTIVLRFSDYPHHLLRLDFGQHLRHKNNYGTDDEYVVTGSHCHVYTLPDKQSLKNVTAISDITEFQNIAIISEAYSQFLEYTNIEYRK